MHAQSWGTLATPYCANPRDDRPLIFGCLLSLLSPSLLSYWSKRNQNDASRSSLIVLLFFDWRLGWYKGSGERYTLRIPLKSVNPHQTDTGPRTDIFANNNMNLPSLLNLKPTRSRSMGHLSPSVGHHTNTWQHPGALPQFFSSPHTPIQCVR